jgi:predicted DNA-binding protein with PD1-like motif
LISKREGSLVVFRIEDGRNLVESLKGLVEEHGLESAFILSGIGMLRNVEISYYSREKKGYLSTKLNEPVELLSLSGNISLQNNESFLHLHVTLAKENTDSIGGHLKNATVHNTLEGAILQLNKLRLRKDPETRILSII